MARLEAAWSGQSGDAARNGLKPFADAATSSSTALFTGQNTLTDQGHVFQSTRDSMQDVSDSPPERDAVDVLSVWDTDTEDQINKNNAAIQQNKQIYREFTSTSDGHALTMPTEYGQMPDAQGDFSIGNPPAAPDQRTPTVSHSTFSQHSPGLDSHGPGGSSVSPPAQYQPGHIGTGLDGNPQVPAAHGPGGDGTQSAGFVPPSHPGPGGVWSSDPTRFGPVGPGGSSSYGPGSGGPGGSPGFGGGFDPGVSGPGNSETGGRGSAPGAGPRSGGLGGGGRTGSGGRVGGGVDEPVTRGGTGAAGGRGGSGMPMGATGGKGNKEEDKEKKAASYLLEPDPNALFGYDGKAVPPVIGQ
ncbi:hypothetical protein [Amycolatopsis sulphurea]|uniref:hypothetical protein n=1 Tax=Amycolatopsis sulphurea TaxID=76022 RepID=UPI000BF5C19F|nr:hypothetical protein [Amycolatopsis sulphurea]